MRLFLIGIVVLGLGGCRGEVFVENVSRSSDVSSLNAILEAKEISDPAALPTVGGANYVGYSRIKFPIAGEMTIHTGDLEMAVTFAPSDTVVSGTIGNFDDLSGTLVLENGLLLRHSDVEYDYTLIGEVNGGLAAGDAVFNFYGEFGADFLGSGQDGLQGMLYGTTLGPDGAVLFQGDLGGLRED